MPTNKPNIEVPNHTDKVDELFDDYIEHAGWSRLISSGKSYTEHTLKAQLRAYIADEISKAVKNELLQLELGVEMVRLNGGIFSPEKYLEIKRKELEARKRGHNV